MWPTSEYMRLAEAQEVRYLPYRFYLEGVEYGL